MLDLVMWMWMWCDQSIWWLDNLGNFQSWKILKEEIIFGYQSGFREEDDNDPIVHRSDGNEFV